MRAGPLLLRVNVSEERAMQFLRTMVVRPVSTLWSVRADVLNLLSVAHVSESERLHSVRAVLDVVCIDADAVLVGACACAIRVPHDQPACPASPISFGKTYIDTLVSFYRSSSAIGGSLTYPLNFRPQPDVDKNSVIQLNAQQCSFHGDAMIGRIRLRVGKQFSARFI